MKIVYCIAGTYNSGGMERVLANKANYLVQRGYEVFVITTDQRGQQSFFSLDERIQCCDLAINYEENNGKSLFNKVIRYPLKQWKHRERLTACLEQIKPDITISMFCNDASFLWKIKDGSRKVLEIHFSRYKRLQYGRKGIWKIIDRWRSRTDEKTVKKYNRFVVLTHEDKSYWGNLPNITVIPNALTFSTEQPALLDTKKVIAVGRYSYQKGFDYLIAAWAIVHRFQPEWTLDIVGDGEWLNCLQCQIDAFDLNHCICLKSSTSHIEEEYRQASLLVMTSRYEGLPMVLLEAQAFGLPVVSFACKCGPKDVITDGENGFLVSEGNLPMLADRVLRLMEDGELRKRMGMNAYINSKSFSEEPIMKHWIELFGELMSGNV
ncbi:glycosyltransferase family 4 protein [Bacteroides congonensis]|uniref:glycosyltransferase family 4 protein n=1 Tax=Bacteroides congonensis TaxID=1871006 RepID=UPI002FDB546A